MRIYRADDRGEADLGWLHSYQSFGFAPYDKLSPMQFGKLLVLNNDTVKPGQGFTTHSHYNMEIVSIPLSGSLQHTDNIANKYILRYGDVQIMSAGTGIAHSEYNGSTIESVNFLQIWISPKNQNIIPRCEQEHFGLDKKKNFFHTLVSPDRQNNSLWINQDAYISLAAFEASTKLSYSNNLTGNGLYIFVINGGIKVRDKILNTSDAISLTKNNCVDVAAIKDSKLLFIEIPI